MDIQSISMLISGQTNKRVLNPSSTKLQTWSILLSKTKFEFPICPLPFSVLLYFITVCGWCRKLRSRRGNEIAGQVLQNAPEFCEVKIICEGKEVEVGSMSEPPSPHGSSDSPKAAHTQENQRNDSFGCTCFKMKVIAWDRKRRVDVTSGNYSVGRASVWRSEGHVFDPGSPRFIFKLV